MFAPNNFHVVPGGGWVDLTLDPSRGGGHTVPHDPVPHGPVPHGPVPHDPVPHTSVFLGADTPQQWVGPLIVEPLYDQGINHRDLGM